VSSESGKDSKIDASSPIAQKRTTTATSRLQKDPETIDQAEPDARPDQSVRIAAAEISPLTGIIDPNG